MRRLRRFVSRLRRIAAGRRLDQELRDEIASHLAEAADEYARRGLSPEEARRAALVSFGGITQTMETHRDVRGWAWIEWLLQDVRRAVRLLRRSPAVTAVAVLSLAMGMGGTTTMLSLVNGLILRPLPVRNPERLVSIIAGEETANWKMPVWDQLRARTDLLDGLFAWEAQSVSLADLGKSQRARALLVSGGMFEILGLNPQVGRLLRPSDDIEQGGTDGRVAVISDGFWRRHYGGAPDIAGRTLRLNEATLTIVGVAPASFFGLEVGWSFDVAVPLAAAPLLEPAGSRDLVFHNLWLAIMGRLQAGQDVAGAAASLQAAMPAVLDAAEAPLPRYRRLPPQLRDAMTMPRVILAPGGPSSIRDQYGRSVTTVTAIAAIVLLIACVNLAHLFLARGEARRREFAITIALGATRARLVRQLVIEGLVLSVLGAMASLAIAMWAAPLLIQELSNARQTIAVATPVDWRLLSFTGATAMMAGVIFGVAPAIRSTRLGPNSPLGSFTSVTHDLRNGQVNSTLAALQIALSLVLTVSAALLVGTFVRLQQHDLGFDPEAVLVLGVSLRGSAAGHDDAARYRRMLDAVEAMPEVAAAAFANVQPLTRGRMMSTLVRGGDGARRMEQEVFAVNVTPGWFETMGIPIRSGRSYWRADEGRRDVIVVNRALARQFFGEENPVGSMLQSPDGRRTYTVVGVIEDAVYRSAREGAPATAYFPAAPSFGNLSIRSAIGDPDRLTSRVIETITRADPDVQISAAPMSDYARATVATERVTAMLAGFFGMLALVLAAVGTYGVMAYSVSRRRAELAIRRALGATGVDITRLVVGRTVRIAAAGIGLGTIVSLQMSGLVAPLLYGATATDPVTFVGAAVVLLSVALAAAWLPARRAARFNPATLLRDS